MVSNGQIEVRKMYLDMCSTQYDLNVFTNGNTWYNRVTNKGKRIDWSLCLIMEATELINSLNWKHWKDIENEEIDITNIKIELVDILHFFISLQLNNIYDVTKFKNKEHMLAYIDSNRLYPEYEKLTTIEENKSIDPFDITLIKHTKKIITTNWDSLVIKGKDVCYLHRLNTMESINSISYIIAILYQYFGYTFKDIYSLYIGKYSLNKLRQEYGYKEGTYKKIWKDTETGEEVEDNVIMDKLLKDSMVKINNINSTNFYTILRKEYLKQIKEEV